MKRTFVLTVLLVLAGVLPAFAGLEASPGLIEFGNLKEGPPAQKTVTLTNTGSKPLQISNVSTSCACTTTKLGRETLAPGQTTELAIIYQTFKYAGKFDKTVTIEHDGAAGQATVIHLIGFVDPVPMGVLEMTPRKVEVGHLKAKQTNTVQIPVRNSGDAPLTVSKVVSIKYKKTLYQAGASAMEIPAGGVGNVPLSIEPAESGNYLDIILVHSEDARNDVGQGYKAVLVGRSE